MSRNSSIAARGGLIAFAFALELVVAYFLVAHPPANMGEVFMSPGGLGCLALHMLACILLAAGFGGFLPGGSASDRASVVVLYFVLAFVLPIAGIAGVALLGVMLGRGGKETEPEPLFEIGNPLLEDLAHGGDAPAPPHLEPLAESMRSLDTAELRRAVLALRGRAERADVKALLKRFRGAADSELQFFADSALAGAADNAETQAAKLAEQIDASPEHPLAHSWMAEGILAAAEGSADRRLLAQAALEHLEIARRERPESWRLARLSSRAALMAGDVVTARKTLGDDVEAAPEGLEVLFKERRWADLRRLADSGAVARPELAEALAFWGTEDEGGLA